MIEIYYTINPTRTYYYTTLLTYFYKKKIDGIF